jgi:outer membrane lipoprotein carrier protein
LKRTLIAVSVAALLAPPLLAGSSWAEPAKGAAPAAAAPSAEEIAEVQAFYDKTKTFKASFKQKYVVIAYDKTVEDAGSVIFQKPGKMSWRYTSNGNRIVSDGQSIKVYEKKNQQMLVQQVGASQYPTALSFLTGQGKLTQNFKLTKQDAKQMKFESGYVLKGEPLQPMAAYDYVLFYVDAQTSQIRRVMIVDVQGNRNRLDFEGGEVNTKPPPGEFSFTPPAGTRIIRGAPAPTAHP